MKIIDIPGGQGSPLWHAWRMAHITATSAGILMGNNPWKNPEDLYDEMMGLKAPTVMNAAMQRGTDLEPIARQLFIEQIGIEFEPIVVESDENPWMGASLDGWSESCKAVLEIKCPGTKTHNEAILGMVPEYYMDQVQHQLACTGGRMAFYITYHPDHNQKLAVVEIKPNHEYIKQIIETERKFYFENLCKFQRPGWELKPKNCLQNTT